MADVTPIVKGVVEAVKAKIRSGGYEPGSFLPSEADLANDLRVSRGTVRKAIEALVAEGDIVRRPHSRPIIAYARALPTGHRDTRPGAVGQEVHVWVSHLIADEPTLMFLRGVSRSLVGTPYRLVVREPSRFVGPIVQSDERAFLSNVLVNDDVAGIIIQRESFAKNEDAFQALLARGKKIVFVDSAPPKGVEADHVGTANAAAARKVTEYLLRLGHTHIVFAADSDIPTPIEDRIRGYRRAMQQAGVPECVLVATDLPPADPTPKPRNGDYAHGLVKNAYFSEMSGRLIEAIQKLETRPTAIFVCHDVLAYWLSSFLEGIGIRVPEDVSVSGFDHLARWDSNIADTLTTVEQDFEGFGRHAAELLLDRFHGDIASTPRHVLLDAPLVIRSSTVPDLQTSASPPVRDLSASGAAP